MWQRFLALVSALQSHGHVPARLRVFVSVAGIAVITTAIVVFVNQSWGTGVTDSGIVYTGLILVVGVLLLRSATVPPNKGPEDDP